MVFYGVLLRLHYHMTSIGYIDTNFAILPWLLIGVGASVFIVSAFGLVVSATESRLLLISYAAVMAVCCIALFATAFICILTSEKINDDDLFEDNNANPTHRTNNYFNNKEFRNNFDYLQRVLGCCSFTDGSSVSKFTNKNTKITTENCNSVNTSCQLCYPDSCYVQHSLKSNYGQRITKNSDGECRTCTTGKDDHPSIDIYTTDCIAILKELYKTDLVGGTRWLAVAILVTAVFGVAAVAMAAGYVGKLKRKEKKQNFSQGVRMQDLPN